MGGLAGSTNVFSNTGTFTKTGGGSTVFRNNPGAGNSGVLFNNSGTVEVQEGTLQLLAGGTHTGDFTGATGTTLKFAGTHTFSANSDVSGGMNVDYSGTMQITGTLTSTTTGTTTLNGTVTGSGDWDVSGPWAWTGGTMSGSGTTIVANGSISGAGTKTLNDRILRSAGNIEWSEGNITTTGSSANLIVNGGFETPVIGQSFNTYYAGSTQLAPWEILSGSVDIVRTFWPANEGQNSLDLGGYSSGTLEQSFATVPGREYTLSFQYGNHPLNTNASGRINVIGTTTLLDSVLNHSSSTYPNMAWTPYTTTFIADSTTTTLRFTDLTNSSIGFALDAVSVMSTQTTSTIHVPDGTSFTIIGSGNKSLNANLQIDAGGTLLHTSTGTTTHTAGSFVNNGLVQVDAGTLQFNAGGTGNGEFVVAPGATLQFNGPGHNYTGGVTLNNGVFQLQNFELTNGTVQGTGTIDALTFTNSSNVAPGLSLGNAIGTFSITGDYAQTSDGKLDVDIEDLSTFDTLSIAGDANLGGTLTVTIPDDGSIEAGDSFEIITAGDILGTEFDDVITEGADGFFLAPVYSELSVALFTYNDGDMNRSGDGTADQDDVPAFALALTNPRNYRSQFGISAKEAGDIDGDGDCDVDDIDDFADLLGMSISQLTYQMQLALAVPEPSSVLILLGQALLLLRRRPTSQVFR
jgi:choice-of-anchor C domain-containing protein